MSRQIEHLAVIHGPDTGVDAYVHDQEKDQENAGEAHYEFFAYGRSKEFRPFHALIFVF
jgi:hypothetical protein